MGGGIGMGNTCKPMAVSFQCMTKFTTNKKKNLMSFTIFYIPIDNIFYILIDPVNSLEKDILLSIKISKIRQLIDFRGLM